MNILIYKTLFFIQPIISQIEVTGLNEAAKTSPLNAALVGFIVILLAAIAVLWRQLEIGRNELKELNKEHASKLSENKKEYVEKFEKLQSEYLRREEERNKQWSDSEKEMLNVLNGVTSILELSEKMGQKDTHEVLEKLRILEEKIITAINNK